MSKAPKKQPEQLLHLVFGGELTDLDGVTFKDVAKLDIVGIFPNFEKAAEGLARQGARDDRQCADALLHRASAPPARSRDRRDEKEALAFRFSRTVA